MNEDKIRLYVVHPRTDKHSNQKGMFDRTHMDKIITNEKNKILHTNIKGQDIGDLCFLTDDRHGMFTPRKEQLKRNRRVYIQDRSQEGREGTRDLGNGLENDYIIGFTEEKPQSELESLKKCGFCRVPKFIILGVCRDKVGDFHLCTYDKDNEPIPIDGPYRLSHSGTKAKFIRIKKNEIFNSTVEAKIKC